MRLRRLSLRCVAFIDIIGSSGHKLLIFEASKEIVSREEELKATVVLAPWIGALISTGSGPLEKELR